MKASLPDFFTACRLTYFPTEGRYTSINLLVQREPHARLLPHASRQSQQPWTFQYETSKVLKNVQWHYRNSDEYGTNMAGIRAYVGVGREP